MGSPWITRLTADSNGRMMLSPKLLSRLAPAWPASMMPAAAPVMVIHPRSLIRSPNAWAAKYAGWSGRVRADPNTPTLRVPR